MTSDQRSTRHQEAALAAAGRAREAHDRLVEIEQRLGDLRRSVWEMASGPAHVSRAEREAVLAVARRTDSSRRAQGAREASMAAHESAARAHERAAEVHERAAAVGVGDIEDHRRLSAWHRQAAAADRAALDDL